MLRTVLFLLLAACACAKDLQIYFVDVEGGQATMLVTPAGESMLIDAGWPGHNMRDAKRIQEAAKKAGIKRLDYVVITHFHEDHVGGVQQLVQVLPVRNFVDKGPNTEKGLRADTLTRYWNEATKQGQHMTVKPGDKIPVKGLDVTVVTGDGAAIPRALPGAGGANPACANVQRQKDDPTENARSLGMVIKYNNWRMLNLGDLTYNKELELVCPENKLGPMDLFVVTHHGFDISNAPALVSAIKPKVSVIENGPRKGAAASVVKQLMSQGQDSVWQLHYAVANEKDANVADPYIANVNEADEGHWLRITVDKNGGMTVFNPRNKFSKTYR